jgi:hypothetical protein
MKKLALALAVSIVLLAPILAGPKDRVFTGMITDRFCQMAGSHDEMMKKHNVTNVHDCIPACVKAGGKFVLYDEATKTIYLLDDQVKPEKFAQQKVKITGTFDKATATLHVVDIQPLA